MGREIQKKIVVSKLKIQNRYEVSLIDYSGKEPTAEVLKIFTHRDTAMRYKKKMEEGLGL